MGEPIQVEWLIEGRLLRVPGTTNREMMTYRNRLVLEAIERQGSKPMVHVLIDHRTSCTSGDEEAQPRSARDYILDHDEIRERLLSNPLLGWVISVATPNAGLKMAGTVTSQRDAYRWRSVATMEEALDWLQQVDGTLPNLSALGIE